MTPAEAAQRAGRGRLSFWIAVLGLFASVVAFFTAIWIYQALRQHQWLIGWSTELTRETLVSAVTAWAAIGFTGNPWEDSVRLWIDRFFSAVGFNLMVQYGLDYLFHIPPTPWPAALAGSVLAIAMIAAVPKGGARPVAAPPGSILLLGYDSTAEAIRPFLDAPIAGALSSSAAAVPAGVPYLGGLNCFEDVFAARKPARILMNDASWPAAISPRRMLALRYAGITVEDVPSLFETFLKRIRWDHLDAGDLLFSPRLNINRSAIALQAIYTNVIGLSLLVLFSPVLILAAALTVIATGASPLKRIPCLGFQRIPFELLCFRTRRRGGKPAWSGSLLKALRLINLPQLINVVRGEMALFGPPPVRREFAELLSRWIPIYAHRFTVKPGIMGWSQANLAARLPVPDESLRLEYDLYYIREESPSLDLDILFRTIFRHPLDVPSRPE
jgi:lipopolysaccharide/colanic/teichoic acid biosynthesis glycosyltransferase